MKSGSTEPGSSSPHPCTIRKAPPLKQHCLGEAMCPVLVNTGRSPSARAVSYLVAPSTPPRQLRQETVFRREPNPGQTQLPQCQHTCTPTLIPSSGCPTYCPARSWASYETGNWGTPMGIRQLRSLFIPRDAFTGSRGSSAHSQSAVPTRPQCAHLDSLQWSTPCPRYSVCAQCVIQSVWSTLVPALP